VGVREQSEQENEASGEKRPHPAPPEDGEGKDSPMPKPILTFWYEFASTYSWLAGERIEALAAAADVEVDWRPFLLGPIFVAQGWPSSPFNVYAAKGANMWRDIERHCLLMNLPPPTRPEPFPQNGLLAARVATALPAAARPAFSCAVYRAEFTKAQPIADRAVIAQVLRDCGVDAEATLATAESRENKAALRVATDEAARHGIYGAPTFVTSSGELFWGNDRLEQALAWAKRET
jgi:2-hydroxychromene-2-carboxylate isomerase